MMNNYFKLVSPTYIENWSKELCSLSIGQVGIKLSLKEAEALGSNIKELYKCFPKPYFRDISSIYKKIEKEIIKFPKGIFVRLGSRSPKDSLYESQLQCFNTEDVINRLTACSERIYEDLSLALNNKYEPYIWLREWKEIPGWAEFRCFMKDRKLVGISQYNYLKESSYPEIIEKKEIILANIKLFFEDFKTKSHLDNIVFDVFLQEKTTKEVFDYDSRVTIWICKLLEINPFFEMTDPCLFDWRKPEEFKGQFLYNN